MITITAGDKTIELYGSIKELPVRRYKLMQQYLLQESGIGSDISAIDDRLSRTVNFLENSKPDEAKEELINLRYAMFSAISGLDYKSKAFSCLVCRVNDQLFTDMSSEGLERLVEILDALPVEEIEKHWDGVKKKLIPNLEPTSPDISEVTLNTLKT